MTIVKLTNGKYLDSTYRDKVITMHHKSMDVTKCDDKEIHIVAVYKTDDELTIIVEVK